MSKGRHLILDLYDCDLELLNDYESLEEWLKTALLMAEATILRIIGEQFEPQGVTLLALLAESHASIHTWPEIGYAAIDLYTCGDTTKTEKAAEFLKEKLKAKRVEEKEIPRPVYLPAKQS
ncbi:MAG: adenosylmethionine decarboxylase [Prolixibacteraceae bacterium]